MKYSRLCGVLLGLEQDVVHAAVELDHQERDSECESPNTFPVLEALGLLCRHLAHQVLVCTLFALLTVQPWRTADGTFVGHATKSCITAFTNGMMTLPACV